MISLELIEKTSKAVEELNNQATNRLHAKIEYYKQELQIRCESLKNELDQLEIKFINDMKNLKSFIRKSSLSENECTLDQSYVGRVQILSRFNKYNKISTKTKIEFNKYIGHGSYNFSQITNSLISYNRNSNKLVEWKLDSMENEILLNIDDTQLMDVFVSDLTQKIILIWPNKITIYSKSTLKYVKSIELEDIQIWTSFLCTCDLIEYLILFTKLNYRICRFNLSNFQVELIKECNKKLPIFAIGYKNDVIFIESPVIDNQHTLNIYKITSVNIDNLQFNDFPLISNEEWGYFSGLLIDKDNYLVTTGCRIGDLNRFMLIFDEFGIYKTIDLNTNIIPQSIFGRKNDELCMISFNESLYTKINSFLMVCSFLK